MAKPAAIPAGASSAAAAAAPAPSKIKPAPVAPVSAAPATTEIPAPLTGAQNVRAKSESTAAVMPAAQELFVKQSKSPAPEFILSAGMEPSRSWFSTYKWILLVLVLIVGGGAAFLFLR